MTAAAIELDTREDYGEERFSALDFLDAEALFTDLYASRFYCASDQP